jgi:hypothetical protein
MSEQRDQKSSEPESSSAVPHEDGSRLERFLNSNPLVLLIGVGVGVATVIAGVMTYLTTQKLDALEIQHKAEITELSDKGREELFNVTQPLKTKIEDLNFRLSSIERRVPGAGPSYLDVSTVTIGPEALQSLSTKYTSYDDDGFLVAVPSGGNWTFSLTNELDYVTSIYSFFNEIVQKIPQFNSLSKAPVFLWKSTSELHIFATMLGENSSFTYHPMVSVQRVDQNLIKARAEMIQEVLDAPDDEKVNKNIASKIGPVLDKKKDVVADSVSAKPNHSDKSSAQTILDKTKKKQEVVEALNQLVSNDLATFAFLDVASQLIIQNTAWPLHNYILSVQKKGNVFYLQMRISFRDVETSVNGGPRNKSQNVSVDEEIFFFGTGTDGYLVKVVLPPVPDRADNFAWSKSWLTGLQIPIR